MNNEFEEQEKRIAAIFRKKFRDITKRTKTLEFYKAFLEKELDFPVKLKSVEYFKWEEYYVLGPGDKKEYEELKKTRASLSDVFNLVRIDKHIDEEYGLFAKVTRVSDRKRFTIPLIDLKAHDEESKNYQLLIDYVVWCSSYDE
ncbi:MAG: hypothetical protein GW823_04550 [Bacteroidetes bacterium]|nr:hypothetical protein [Bacteroidota bacterium]